jgi:hypothetical protein
MSKLRLREVFAKTVCAHAGSVIAAALCLAGLFPVFLIGAAFVPEGWFLKGLTRFGLVAGLLLFRRSVGYRLLMNSVMTGVSLIAIRFGLSLLSVIAPVRATSLHR